MDEKLLKVFRNIYKAAIVISVAFLLLWRIFLQRVTIENHFTVQSSAYLLGVLGVVMLGIMLCLRMLCRKDKGIVYLVLVDFMIATWIYLRSEAVVDAFAGSVLIEAIKLSMLSLVCVPIVQFFDEFHEFRYHKSYVAFLIIPVIDWICSIIALLLLDANKKDVYLSAQIVALFILTICMYHLGIEIVKQRSAISRQVFFFMLFGYIGSIGEFIYAYKMKYESTNALYGFMVFFTLLGIFKCVAVSTVRSFQKEELHKKEIMREGLLEKFNGEIKESLESIIQNNQYVLEHCVKEDMFQVASETDLKSERLYHILNNFVDCVELSSGRSERKSEKVEFAKVFNQIVNETTSEAEERNVELYISVEEKIPRAVWGVSYYIERMIVNMLHYALHYAEIGGKVNFQTGFLHVKDDVIKVITTIENSGLGLERKEVERIQKILEHLEDISMSELTGLGPGIQTAASFAKVMKCTMAIESEPGKGIRMQTAFVCKVEDETPIGEFQDWYEVKETFYQKYRKRLIKIQEEEARSKNKNLYEMEKEDNTKDIINILISADIHVNGALKYVGSDMNQYVQIMKLFPEKKAEKQKLLQEYFDTKDYQNYTIQVHALKNNARMLGADKLADMAFEHEKRGTQKDGQYIEENYDSLIEEWNRVSEAFREYLDAEQELPQQEQEKEQNAISMEEWRENLEKLIAYLDAFQKKEALEVLEKMQGYQMEKWQNEVITKALEAIKKYDYDGAIAALKKGQEA